MSFKSLPRVVAILAGGLLPAVAENYTYISSTGNTSWATPGAWSPSSGASGPGIADNIVAITGGGTLNLQGARAINNFTMGASTTQNIVIFSTVASSLAIGGTDGNGTLTNSSGFNFTIRPNNANPLDFSVNDVNLSSGINSFGVAAATDRTLNSFTQTATKSFLVTSSTVNISMTSGTRAVLGNMQINIGAAININEAGTGQGVIASSLAGTGASVIRASSIRNVTANLAVDPGSGVTTTYAGSLQNGFGTSELSFTKQGLGTQILTGSSSYSGATAVTAGTLLVNNTAGSATGSSAVAVSSGATLGGGNGAGNGGSASIIAGSGASLATYATGVQGMMSGPLSLASGAHLSPGNSVGTIEAGALSLANGSILDYEFNLTANDFTAVTGLLQLDGVVGINLFGEGTGDPFSTVGVYNLFSYGTLGGFSASSFTVLNAVGGYEYTFTNNSANNLIQLTVAVPEPTTWLLLGLGFAFVLWRARGARRRDS